MLVATVEFGYPCSQGSQSLDACCGSLGGRGTVHSTAQPPCWEGSPGGRGPLVGEVVVGEGSAQHLAKHGKVGHKASQSSRPVPATTQSNQPPRRHGRRAFSLSKAPAAFPPRHRGQARRSVSVQSGAPPLSKRTSGRTAFPPQAGAPSARAKCANAPPPAHERRWLAQRRRARLL